MRTTRSSTPAIAFLPDAALRLPGRIGLAAAAPGADLAAVLTALGDRGTLLSLLTRAEGRAAGVRALGARLRAAGGALHELALPADDAPPAAVELPARALVRAAVDAAAAGRTVVLLCGDGRGRAGMVAAACLVARGSAPAEALAAVRAVQPGAVGSPAQQAWASGAARPCSPEDRRERLRGCLLGGALGDALGEPVEFLGGAELERRHGTQPPLRLAFAGRARITDDTQMTLFSAEGIIRGQQRGRDRGLCNQVGVMQGALLRWYGTQTGRGAGWRQPGWLVGVEGLHAQRAPGNTCLSALARLAKAGGEELLHAVDRPANDSKGCGAVMRAAPFGAVRDRAWAFQFARDAGALTHGHPSGYLSAAYLGSVVWGLLRGEALPAAMAASDALLAAERGRSELVAILGRVRELAARGVPDRAAVESLGGGWVGEEALAIGLLCALTVEPGAPRGVERALWRAVAHGGDSDSTGSIVGNLLGAQFGLAALPAGWLDELELRDVIDRVAVDLDAALHGEALSHEDYPPN